MTAVTKDTRLVARVNSEIHELVNQAAEMTGSTVSQFIVEAVQDRARRTLEEACTLKLSLQGARNILAALEKPPRHMPRLAEAARRYKEMNIYDSNHPADM